MMQQPPQPSIEQAAGDRFACVAVLGHSPSSVVYLVRETKLLPVHLLRTTANPGPKTMYVIKCLRKVDCNIEMRKSQEQEDFLHPKASCHPSVLTLHEVFKQDNDPYLYLLLEYCPEGDLFTMITVRQRNTVPRFRQHDDGLDLILADEYQRLREDMDYLIKDIFNQLIKAVEYCHSQDVFHCDIKPENILCRQQGTKILLADFGLAAQEKTSSAFRRGTVSYMSPENHGGVSGNIKDYNTASNDVWALGVIFVNLITSRNPWDQATLSDTRFAHYLRDPNILFKTLPISRQSSALLKHIFWQGESSRCSASELERLTSSVGALTVPTVGHDTAARKSDVRSQNAHIAN